MIQNMPILENTLESVYITAKEAGAVLGVSSSTVSRIFKQINTELKKKGKIVLQGKCNRREFYRAIGAIDDNKTVADKDIEIQVLKQALKLVQGKA